MHHAGNPHQKKEQISIAIKSFCTPAFSSDCLWFVSCGWTILITPTTGHQWIEAKLISNVTDHWIKKHVKISILTLSTRLLFSLQNYSLLAKEDVSEQISECTYIVVPNWSYRQLILFQSHMFLLTKSQRLIAVVNVLTSNSNQWKFHCPSKLNCIVAVLYFLHLSTHLFKRRSIDLIPVDNPWFHNIIELQDITSN